MILTVLYVIIAAPTTGQVMVTPMRIKSYGPILMNLPIGWPWQNVQNAPNLLHYALFVLEIYPAMIILPQNAGVPWDI